MRHRSGVISRQAAPDPDLRRRLQQARLYVITPDSAPGRVLEVVSAAVRGGADVVQLRHKTMPRGELLRLARQVREITREVLFVVNDYVDIALLSEADGVHLGPDDLSIAGARTVAGEGLLIGASASTLDAAQQAVGSGADYLGSGPAFATPIKGEKGVIGPAAIFTIANAVDVPVFAIGGINESNVAEVVATGLRRVCMIRAVGDAADPEAVTRRLRAMLDA